jgi:hypothetical protein
LHNNFPGCWNTCFFCCLSLCASLLLNLFLELLPRSISHVYRSMHVHTPHSKNCKEFWYTVATLGSLNFFHTFIISVMFLSFHFKMILFYFFSI